MEQYWDDKCHGKKDDKCVINIFCNCKHDKCEVKWHDKKGEYEWDNKKQDGKCVINIFCNCGDDKKHGDNWDACEKCEKCEDKKHDCECHDEGTW